MQPVELWLDESIKKSSELLTTLQNGGEISDVFFAEASTWAEELANQIRLTYVAATPLLETNDIKSVEELLLYKQKAIGEFDVFRQMSSIIQDSSKRTRIQKRAIDEILAGRKDAIMPMLGKDGFIPIDLAYDFSGFIEEFHPLVCEVKDGCPKLFLTNKDFRALAFIDDCILACGSLHSYVSGIRKVPDPPDDWFKEPHQTLLNGGDCDDLAILYCALARSVGFSTYLAFQPGHVYPGVFVGVPIEVSKENLPQTLRTDKRVMEAEKVYEIVKTKIPADPTIPVPKLVLNFEGSTYQFNYFGLYATVFGSMYIGLSESEKGSLEPVLQKVDDCMKKMVTPQPRFYFLEEKRTN